jgi:metallophosphoesterase superfamily enzyme
MTDFIVHNINYNTFLLLPQKCLFWENQKTLVLADLHFGKTGHFRKNGIGVPQSIFKEDMQRLLSLIQYFKPQNVLIIGDLFTVTPIKNMIFLYGGERILPG